MVRPRTLKASAHRAKASRSLTPAARASYTYDMLLSLRKIAALHKEAKLMRLIEAAAEEAEALVKREIV